MPTAVLTVTDTGAGMSREFIQERLFKPFDTTKGSKGMGIGAYQVREYVQSLGGRVEVAAARWARAPGSACGCRWPPPRTAWEGRSDRNLLHKFRT